MLKHSVYFQSCLHNILFVNVCSASSRDFWHHFNYSPCTWCHSGAEKGDISKEMLLLSHLSRTVPVTYSNLLQPRVLNPQRLKHMEIDNSGIISGFYGE